MKVLDMLTSEDIKRIKAESHSTKRIEQLEVENKKLKKRAQEAEGENTIIKGIGNNSPEMKELQGRLSSAQDINDNHQRYNGELQRRLTEVEGDNKTLAKQIEDYREMLRKAGL